METKLTCPLGSVCESAKDGYIERCSWYTKLQGHNPQNNQPIDEWRCAIQWLPLMQIENTGQQRRTGAAIESFRNEMTKDNQKLASVLSMSKPDIRLIEND